MRALAPALALLAGGCASHNMSADLQPLATPEVCYVGMVSPEYRQLAYEEVARRETSCERYTAEIRAIDQAMHQRAAERQAAAEREAAAGRASSLAASPAMFIPQLRPWRRR
jgi:hypothetical protein